MGTVNIYYVFIILDMYDLKPTLDYGLLRVLIIFLLLAALTLSVHKMWTNSMFLPNPIFPKTKRSSTNIIKIKLWFFSPL